MLNAFKMAYQRFSACSHLCSEIYGELFFRILENFVFILLHFSRQFRKICEIRVVCPQTAVKWADGSKKRALAEREEEVRGATIYCSPPGPTLALIVRLFYPLTKKRNCFWDFKGF